MVGVIGPRITATHSLEGSVAMTEANSTRSPSSNKPKKPYDSFPLSPHATGCWCKRIRGRLHYFGPWARRVNGKLVRVEGDGWQAALESYNAQAADLHAGRQPRSDESELTVKKLANE